MCKKITAAHYRAAVTQLILKCQLYSFTNLCTTFCVPEVTSTK